jgi:hypothetical protein
VLLPAGEAHERTISSMALPTTLDDDRGLGVAHLLEQLGQRRLAAILVLLRRRLLLHLATRSRARSSSSLRNSTL